MNTELKKDIEQAGKDYIKQLIKELVKAGKKSSGNLINSLDYKIVETVEGFAIEILAADYLTQVDQGRKKGKQPPVKAIKKWVKAEGIRFKGQTSDQTAFVIARSIGNKGIKKTSVIEKTKKNVLNSISNIIASAVEKDLEATIDHLLKEFK